jgi:drug/metabolite transporter (DMT)-like permease
MTHRRAVALMILTTLMWSIAGVVTRQLEVVQGFEATFWRSLFNALTLIAVLGTLRGPELWRTLRNSGWPLWLSGLCWATMYTAFMVALNLTTVANVLVTLASGPLITALFARIFLGHKLAARTWFAIAVASSGIAWMFGRDAAAGVSLLGTLIAFAVPVCAAINWTLLQFVARCEDSGTTPDMLPAVLIGATLSALATLPAAYPLQVSVHDMSWLALLGVVQLAVPCLLVVRLSRELPAAEIALLGLLEVVFGVAWAWLGAGETPSAATAIGGALVIGGLLINELLALKGKGDLAAA